MQFTRLHSRQVYPCWTAQYYQYKVYIRELIVMQVFHFRVVSGGKTVYSSIEDNIYFSEFEETVEYIEKWVKENIRDKRTVYNEFQFE